MAVGTGRHWLALVGTGFYCDHRVLSPLLYVLGQLLWIAQNHGPRTPVGASYTARTFIVLHFRRTMVSSSLGAVFERVLPR